MSSSAVLAAARNNAAWCDAVCLAAGGRTRFAPGLWWNEVASPPHFPNLVTTLAAVDPVALEGALRRVSTAGVRFGVKDSFCSLDLAPAGFSLLFEARWIWRDPVPLASRPSRLRWDIVASASDLQAWESAWAPQGPGLAPVPGLLGAALLARPEIAFLAGREGGVVRAGVALTETDGTVGLAGLFLHGPDPDALRQELLNEVAACYPGRAMLGYEAGDDLLAMQRQAFQAVGPLRVWLSAAPD